METQTSNFNELKTRNLYKNYSTEKQNFHQVPLNSKFNCKRQSSIEKAQNVQNLTNADVSILFSAVRNKTTNQMTSTYEEVMMHVSY